MHYTYSIIIPHRDSPNLLERAVNSIPDRNDIQVIVVDNSLEENDLSFLIPIYKKTTEIFYSDVEKGAGHARNIGLSKANGNWILFLDADDFFNPGAFDQFDKHVNSNFDIVYFNTNSVCSKTYEKAERHITYSELISDYFANKKNAEDNLRYKFVSPWAKLIKSKLIEEHGILFDEVPASNDLMFSVKTGHFAQNILADSFTVYCITVSSGSLTRTINSKNSRSRFLAGIRQYHFMNSIGRPDLRFNLMAEVVKSFRFGLKEFLWYITIAFKERINIFLGMKRWPEVLYRNLVSNKSK